MSNKADNSVTHVIPHDLPHELAGKAGRKAINGYVKQFKQLKGRWETPTKFVLEIKVPFNKLTGHVDIQVNQIFLKIDKVPAMFKGFVGQAIDTIDEAVKDHLNKAKLDG